MKKKMSSRSIKSPDYGLSYYLRIAAHLPREERSAWEARLVEAAQTAARKEAELAPKLAALAVLHADLAERQRAVEALKIDLEQLYIELTARLMTISGD